MWASQENSYKYYNLFLHGHTVCTFSGKSTLSSQKTTLKQQINGHKRWKMKEKDLSCFGWVFTACSVLRRLLAFNLPSTEQAAKTEHKQVFLFHCSSFFFTVYLLFKCRFVSCCGLIKGISPQICILCVRVKINKRSFRKKKLCLDLVLER